MKNCVGRLFKEVWEGGGGYFDKMTPTSTTEPVCNFSVQQTIIGLWQRRDKHKIEERWEIDL